MIKVRFKTKNVCAKYIDFLVEQDIVEEVSFVGGCDGNHKGLCALVKGLHIDEVIAKLQGITCGDRNTSCPDQLAQALVECKGILSK